VGGLVKLLTNALKKQKLGKGRTKGKMTVKRDPRAGRPVSHSRPRFSTGRAGSGKMEKRHRGGGTE